MNKRELQIVKFELGVFIEYMCLALEVDETRNSIAVKANPKVYEMIREIIPEYLRDSLKAYLEVIDRQNEITN